MGKGQTALEYLLLLALAIAIIVVVWIFMSASKQEMTFDATTSIRDSVVDVRSPLAGSLTFSISKQLGNIVRS